MTSGSDGAPGRGDEATCPSCGGTDLVPIVYGLPGPDLLERARSGEVVIGGCIVMGDDPDRACRACGRRLRDSPSRRSPR